MAAEVHSTFVCLRGPSALMTLPVVGAITPNILYIHDYVMAERLQDK